MSVAELKEEAIRQFTVKVVASDDEVVLKMILDFLNGIEPDKDNSISLSHHYNSIKAKYGTVLKKLAE